METKVKKPFYKKWWVWAIVIVVIIGAIASGGGNDDTKPADSKKPTVTDGAKKEEEKTYKIGDDIASGKINVIINSCTEKKEFKSGNQFIENVKTEGKFIVIDAKLTNNDKESRTIDTGMFKLVDSQNREFDVYSKAELMMILDDKYLFLESVNPGMNRTGTFVFEVPEDVSSYSLKIYPGIMFKTGTPQIVKLK